MYCKTKGNINLTQSQTNGKQIVPSSNTTLNLQIITRLIESVSRFLFHQNNSHFSQTM